MSRADYLTKLVTISHRDIPLGENYFTIIEVIEGPARTNFFASDRNPAEYLLIKCLPSPPPAPESTGDDILDRLDDFIDLLLQIRNRLSDEDSRN